ncbi:hypothetical protein HMPREF9123_1286 [Neisseria bacilliformis ATCC BAA-1200]|uniref:Uncharacterized protein n=1 Tax=Neisseria bacilliformis ATCC BAA-1200 TaxID=888742 RepID=F2BC31_9NEIS|nr:hypothetical protein HMPREF9123_1286 [Neisseria bacilliformis ATCC BAA-1200]
MGRSESRILIIGFSFGFSDCFATAQVKKTAIVAYFARRIAKSLAVGKRPSEKAFSRFQAAFQTAAAIAPPPPRRYNPVTNLNTAAEADSP